MGQTLSNLVTVMAAFSAGIGCLLLIVGAVTPSWTLTQSNTGAGEVHLGLFQSCLIDINLESGAKSTYDCSAAATDIDLTSAMARKHSVCRAFAIMGLIFGLVGFAQLLINCCRQRRSRKKQRGGALSAVLLGAFVGGFMTVLIYVDVHAGLRALTVLQETDALEDVLKQLSFGYSLLAELLGSLLVLVAGVVFFYRWEDKLTHSDDVEEVRDAFLAIGKWSLALRVILYFALWCTMCVYVSDQVGMLGVARVGISDAEATAIQQLRFTEPVLALPANTEIDYTRLAARPITESFVYSPPARFVPTESEAAAGVVARDGWRGPQADAFTELIFDSALCLPFATTRPNVTTSGGTSGNATRNNSPVAGYVDYSVGLMWGTCGPMDQAFKVQACFHMSVLVLTVASISLIFHRHSGCRAKHFPCGSTGTHTSQTLHILA
jgi:hypothetical protein